MADRVHGEFGVTVDAEVEVNEYVAQAIVEFARTHDVDVIAMSTHGRGMSRLFLGSIADKVLRSAGLPVLLRRPVGVHGRSTLTDDSALTDQLSALAGVEDRRRDGRQ